MNLRSILCPVDFSEQSQQALRWAAALAHRFGSRLTVLTAVDPLLAEAARARLGLDLAKDQTGPELREFVNAAVVHDGPRAVEPQLEVRVGQPADVILQEAGRADQNLVVMGTQGLGGLRKMFLGSTAERVLRSGRTTVLAVPPHASAPPAVGGTLALREIVVATDFSETAAAAVAMASDLAQDLAASLTLLHVVESIVVAPQWSTYAEGSEEPQTDEARTRVEQLSASLPGRHDAVVAVGRPAETIASTAAAREAGLIVMGLTGRQGTFAPRPGSTAYRVLSFAKVPVLVVPPRRAT